MKKILAILVLAGGLAACNNSSDSAANTKDSLDSSASAVKERLDSTTDAAKDKIDSNTAAKKDMADSLHKNDSTNK